MERAAALALSTASNSLKRHGLIFGRVTRSLRNEVHEDRFSLEWFQAVIDIKPLDLVSLRPGRKHGVMRIFSDLKQNRDACVTRTAMQDVMKVY